MSECDHGYPIDQLHRCAFCKTGTVRGTWETEASHLIAQWAQERRPFTSEDITDALGFPDGKHHPNGANNRIGRLIGRLAPRYRLRVVAYVLARNPQSHGRKIAEWKAQ